MPDSEDKAPEAEEPTPEEAEVVPHGADDDEELPACIVFLPV